MDLLVDRLLKQRLKIGYLGEYPGKPIGLSDFERLFQFYKSSSRIIQRFVHQRVHNRQFQDTEGQAMLSCACKSRTDKRERLLGMPEG